MRWRAGLVVVLALCCPQAGVAEESGAALTVEPENVAIGLMYSGASVEVNAEAPAGYELAVICSGMPSDVEVKKKGKVLGVLWMNVGDLMYEDVPTLYVARTSKQLDKLAAPEVLVAAGLGWSALRAAVLPQDPPEDLDRFFDQLVALRRHERLFELVEEGLQLEPAANGRVRAEAVFELPPSLPEGQYTVELLGFKDGVARQLATGTLALEMCGAAAWISSLATDHGLAYGIVAVVVAVAAGVFTGLAFQKRKKGPS